MTVISLNGQEFDFDFESKLAAVNEVCSEKDPEAWKKCTLDELCPSCGALATSFKARLIRAFEAGRKSTEQHVPEPVQDAPCV